MAIDESAKVAVEDEVDSPLKPPRDNEDVTVLDLFRKVYQFFYSKVVGLIIILALTVLVLLGAVIGQAPAGTYNDPESKAQFLTEASERYGGWSKVMDFLGLFHIFTSPVFYFVVGMLALSIIACTTHRIPLLWQRYRHPRTHVTDRFFNQARYRASIETDVSAANAMSVIKDHLKSSHYRIIEDEKDPQHGVYADRFAWGGFGTVVAHISFILILLAFALSASSGIDQLITVPVDGKSIAVGNGTNYSIEATSFNATYNEDGRPLDYVSHVVLHEGDKVVAEQDVRVNEPLRYGGMKFHQSTFGISADVLLKNADGKTVYQDTVPLIWSSNDGSMSVGKFEVKSEGIDVLVYTPASGASNSSLEAGQAAFRVYKIGTEDMLTMATVEQGVEAPLGDMSATFEREREYTGITVRQDPGAIWMWIGSALLVLGMMVTFTCRHRRVWIRVEDSSPRTVRFATADKEDLSFERQFVGLVQEANAALLEQSGSTKGGTS